MWYRGLQKLRIDPDELDKYIAERGPLEAQNNSLRLANEKIEAEANSHEIRKATLVAENSALQAVDLVLRTGFLYVPCKSCGNSLLILLPTRESFLNSISTGQVLTLSCQGCGMPQMITPWDFAFQIAWMILPADTATR